MRSRDKLSKQEWFIKNNWVKILTVSAPKKTIGFARITFTSANYFLCRYGKYWRNNGYAVGTEGLGKAEWILKSKVPVEFREV